jgi:outer membrane lipase/esterase
MSSKFLDWPALRLWLQLAALAGASLLASCGGSQAEPFEPTRVLAFGDELSVLDDALTPGNGRKYSVNAFKQVTVDGVTVDDPTTLDCTRSPLWIQTVATRFGLAFDRCLGSATVASGQVLAQVGHKVADLPAQIAAVQGDALGEKDLAVVMIGVHDILELYARYPATSRDDLLAEARERGISLGEQINQLAQSGPAVVLLTVPDISLSPFALAQDTSAGDTTRSALIRDLVATFNDRTSVTLINDGRLIGLVYGDLEIQKMVTSPSSYNLTNVVAAACKAEAVLPDCTTATLVDTATADKWLWADAWRLSPVAQSRLGDLVASRARSNPF